MHVLCAVSKGSISDERAKCINSINSTDEAAYSVRGVLGMVQCRASLLLHKQHKPQTHQRREDGARRGTRGDAALCNPVRAVPMSKRPADAGAYLRTERIAPLAVSLPYTAGALSVSTMSRTRPFFTESRAAEYGSNALHSPPLITRLFASRHSASPWARLPCLHVRRRRCGF